MNIKIYSKTGCPYCERSKIWFQTNDIPYEEELLESQEERNELYRKIGNGVRTVPQIYIDGRRVGGYKELMLEAEDILARLSMEGFDADF